MHRLLLRQLRKTGIDLESIVPAVQALITEVDDAYRSIDDDRQMLERSLDLSSQELLTTNRELRASEEILKRTLQSTADGILAVNNEGRVLHANTRFVELWSIPRKLVEAGDDKAMLEFVLEQLAEPEKFLQKVRELYASDQESFDILSFKDGRTLERYSRPLVDRGTIAGRVWSFRDVTERQLLEEQLRHQAFHDPLTDLANRARFFDRLGHALERSGRTQKPVFVLFLDLDNFKTINDSLGHSLGDRTIVAIANRIARGLAAGDTPARLGGDEFGIILEDLRNLREALQIAGHILTLTRIPLQIDDREIVVDASIGLSAGDSTSSSEELVRNADIAMYAAKNNGKGRIQVYEPGMHTMLSERQNLLSDLRHAIERSELAVYYQPSVSLATGRFAGAEALVRWFHPSRGMILPMRFIPLAEETNLIQAIGEFVLKDACALLKDWDERYPGEGFLVSVNVSAKQIRARHFVERVRGTLAEFQIDPSLLVLEITESAVLEDPEKSLSTLRALKGLGLKLALDDFGTGYSSLSYLKQFPIDVLKIDKSFISDVTSEKEAALTGATIALGQKLKLRIVAEGIERSEQLQHLQALDCELGQGFLFSEALTRQELNQFLETSRGSETRNVA